MSLSYLRKWTDVSAPQLQATTYGSLSALFKAVLVDGYGSTPGLGWTTEFTSPDTHSLVFRGNSVTGTGTLFQVINGNTQGLLTYQALIAGYESMSAWDTGIGRCPTDGTALYIRHGNAATTVTGGIPWVIIGDDRGFWFGVRSFMTSYPASTYGKMWLWYYIGDYIPLEITNTFNFFISGIYDTVNWSMALGTMYPLGSTSNKYYCMRNGGYSRGSVAVGLSSGSPYETSNIGYSVDVSPINNTTHFSIPAIHDSASNVLGFLPGLYNPLMKYGNRGIADENLLDVDVTLTDRVLHLFRYRGPYNQEYNLLPSIGLTSGAGFRNVF